MKRTLLALSLVAIFGVANATGNSPANNNTTNNTTNNNQPDNAGGTAVAGAAAAANSKATATNTTKVDVSNKQGQQQGQVQGQQQSVKNSGNNVGTAEVTVTGPTIEASRIPVSSAYAATVFPTAPCMGSSSGGASGALISISGASSWTSGECMILETARSFDQAGMPQDALAVRCQGQWAKAAPSCKALAANEKVVVETKTAAHVAETKPVVTQAQKLVVVTPVPANVVNYSEAGYYSTVTNPLAQ
jgi:hypothetical protein